MAAPEIDPLVADCADDSVLAAPFPWFGGKSRAAPLVWPRFGDLANYVEPFAGSLAVLLARPDVRGSTGNRTAGSTGNRTAGLETVNDKNAYLANFWRALAEVPDLVAYHAQWPCNEIDVEARHGWLASQHDFREQMQRDPHYFDPKIAGWWVWGISQWIGGGWCERPEWRGRIASHRAPRGIHGLRMRDQIPEYFRALAARLADVRVTCGDWARVLQPSPTTRIGVTGVFLDPPYADRERHEVYTDDSMFLAHEVAEWAIHHGDDPRFRIALCGYEGEREMPASWECVRWKAAGGYSNAGHARGRGNTERERIWFSPCCLRI